MNRTLAIFVLLAASVASAYAATYVIGEQAGSDGDFYEATLAADAVTLLSAVASFTTPCQLVIQGDNEYYWGPATTTVGSVTCSARLLASGSAGRWSISPRKSSYNIGFVSAPGTTAKISVSVIRVEAP